MKDHEHNWIEDPMYADGTLVMISGSANDLGEETRVYCDCGAVDYIRKRDLGSIVDLYKEAVSEPSGESSALSERENP